MPATSSDADRVRRLASVQAAGVIRPVPGVRTFVSVGRLSLEENHARLIRAFRAVHHDKPSTRLVPVGAGPMLADLSALAANSLSAPP